MNDERARSALVRRNTLLLVGAQATLNGIVATYFTLGVIAIVDFTGRERWGGIFLALFNLSAAASALLTGRLMDRVGRRPGLAGGYSLLVAAGVGGALAVEAGSTWALLAVSIPFGVGFGAAQLGRLAAADMVPSERRGRTVGFVVAAGAVGAIAGAPVAAGIERATGSSALPWLVVPVLAVLGLVAVVSLRPDPRDLAYHDAEASYSGQARRTLRQLLRLAPLRAAIVAIGVAQASMVAVMGIAPVVLDDYGASGVVIAIVIGVHMAGMFALAPVAGYLLDTYGRRPGLLAGAILAAGGALIGSFTDLTPLIGLGMFVVGLGWAACFLGATAVISDVTDPAERGGALGFADLVTSATSAGGALAGGFILESSGVAVVGVIMACLLVPVLVLVFPLREPKPGRWTLAPRPQPSP
jgi:MFS family permease